MASQALPGAPRAEPMIAPSRRLLAGLILALSNFMVVLDLTIANVSVPHIAGNLGITLEQGAWIITSYAVAEAICVPLTGWLAMRFGALLTDRGARNAMDARARDTVTKLGGALKRTLAELEPYLIQLRIQHQTADA